MTPEEISKYLREHGIYSERFSAWILPQRCKDIQARIKAQRIIVDDGRAKYVCSNYDPCLGCPHDKRKGGHADKRIRKQVWMPMVKRYRYPKPRSPKRNAVPPSLNGGDESKQRR